MSQNQDLRADPAWTINSGKMKSNPGDFPGFRRLRAAASSYGLTAEVGNRYFINSVATCLC